MTETPDPEATLPEIRLLNAIHEARRQMTAALDEADARVVLPQPTRYVPPNSRGIQPGAHWDVDRPGDNWAPRPTPITVLVSLDDVGTSNPGVYFRGIGSDFADDLDAINRETARALALAILAATDMAGSEMIAKRCTQAARGGAPRG
jgi:hypothetical protein